MESCLTNTKVIVRYLKRGNDFIKHPDHIAYGGLLETANISIAPAVLRNGSYVESLTKSERDFLEKKLTMDEGTLSPHNKEYWDNYHVVLSKHDTILDLSDPIDFIKYKVLKNNSGLVAPNLDSLSVNPKASYRYVLINQGEEDKKANAAIGKKSECYILFGGIRNDRASLAYVLKAITGRSTAKNTKLETLSASVGQLIETNTDTFFRVCSDKYFNTKVLIDKGVRVGAVLKRDGEYFTAENEPLCEKGDTPTLDKATIYLNMPEYQEIKFAIETRIDNARE